MKNFTYLLSISLIAGSLLTGCGGSSDNDDTPATSTPAPSATTTTSTPTPSATTTATTPTPSATTTTGGTNTECEGFLPC